MSGPYLTQVELLNAPTGINWASIPIKGSSTQQQAAEMNNLVLRATAWVDSWCNQKLQATHDTETVQLPGRRAVMRSDRSLYIHTKYSPIVSVQSVSYSVDGATWFPLSGNIVLLDRSAFMLVPGIFSLGLPYQFDPTAGFLQYVYTDGYPNALLTAAPLAAATSIALDDATGILPGSVLTIYSTETTQEEITVAASYVATTGPQTIPLTSGLLYAHSIGDRVSALPTAVREATLLACIHYVRTRGRDTISVSPAGGIRASMKISALEEFDEAKELITPFMRQL